MKILAIETSCDETAIAIVEMTGGGEHTLVSVHANETLSQIDLHREFGGVFPSLAKREHARTIAPLLLHALSAAHMLPSRETGARADIPVHRLKGLLEREPGLVEDVLGKIAPFARPEIDAIAVTNGPGLEPALWVGINFAQALGLLWGVPVIPVNHMEGHLLAPLLSHREDDTFELQFSAFPIVALLVSGGHTELVLAQNVHDRRVIGRTRDDAVGEAFDKVARLLGLPYPGGPEIARLAQKGVPGTYLLPRPMLGTADLDMSFSGLKTAVMYLVRDLGGHASLDDQARADIAREFQDAAIDVLSQKTARAVALVGARSVVIGGGVSANVCLRERLVKVLSALDPGVTVAFPGQGLSTDNALMIALAAGLAPHSAPIGSIVARGDLEIASCHDVSSGDQE
jgi:N6-L-threonylcarbamoyladenine synthase